MERAGKLRRRYRTEKEARAALAEIPGSSKCRDLRAAIHTDGGAGLRGLVAVPPQGFDPRQPRAMSTFCNLCAASWAT
jgi:hypothetical protein